MAEKCLSHIWMSIRVGRARRDCRVRIRQQYHYRQWIATTSVISKSWGLSLLPKPDRKHHHQKHHHHCRRHGGYPARSENHHRIIIAVTVIATTSASLAVRLRGYVQPCTLPVDYRRYGRTYVFSPLSSSSLTRNEKYFD